MKIGDKVTWLYTPRGGYGYTMPVDGEVEAVGKKRIKIKVKKKTGELVSRWVDPSNLRLRNKPF